MFKKRLYSALMTLGGFVVTAIPIVIISPEFRAAATAVQEWAVANGVPAVAYALISVLVIEVWKQWRTDANLSKARRYGLADRPTIVSAERDDVRIY